MSKQYKFSEAEFHQLKHAVHNAKITVICRDASVDSRNNAYRQLSDIQSLFIKKEKKANGSQIQHTQN